MIKLFKDVKYEHYLEVTCGGKTLDAKALRNISANSALKPPIPNDCRLNSLCLKMLLLVAARWLTICTKPVEKMNHS